MALADTSRSAENNYIAVKVPRHLVRSQALSLQVACLAWAGEQGAAVSALLFTAPQPLGKALTSGPCPAEETWCPACPPFGLGLPAAL